MVARIKYQSQQEHRLSHGSLSGTIFVVSYAGILLSFPTARGLVTLILCQSLSPSDPRTQHCYGELV